MSEFIIAVFLLFSIGVICAIVLALCYRFLCTESDGIAARLRAVLPGINCGACTYAGCDGYAEALAKGEAAPNLCTPGAMAVSERIVDILGIDAVSALELVPVVHCNGTHGALLRPALYDGFTSCGIMALSSGGYTACVYSCLGGGDCANVCPADAIRIEEGIARINYTLCISCGACVGACPKRIIEMIPKNARVALSCSSLDIGAEARGKCKNACIGCRKCERACPDGAIAVEENLARINYELCTRCGICSEVCPTGCIKIN